MPAATSVWDFSDGEILTAAKLDDVNCGVHVFTNSTTRTAAYGGTGERTLAAGEMSYLLDTGKIEVYNGTSWVSISTVTKVARFTSSGTWTVPAGVTYAIAHMIGGGGSTGTASWATGGTSSVAFASGTVSADGGGGFRYRYAETPYTTNGTANSGQGGTNFATNGAGDESQYKAQDGAYIVAGAAVTPAASITVTVGAGATAGTSGAAGGTGYVWITYQE